MIFFSLGFKVQALRLQGLYFPPLLHDYILDFQVLRDDDMLLALYSIFQRKHSKTVFIDVVLYLKDFLDIKDVLLTSHENMGNSWLGMPKKTQFAIGEYPVSIQSGEKCSSRVTIFIPQNFL